MIHLRTRLHRTFSVGIQTVAASLRLARRNFRRRSAHSRWRSRHNRAYENLIVYDVYLSNPYMVSVPYKVLFAHLPLSCRFLAVTKNQGSQAFLHLVVGGIAFVIGTTLVFVVAGAAFMSVVVGMFVGGIASAASYLLSMRSSAPATGIPYWVARRGEDRKIIHADVHQDMGLTPQFLRELMKLDADRKLIARKSSKKTQARLALGATVGVAATATIGLFLVVALIGS